MLKNKKCLGEGSVRLRTIPVITPLTYRTRNTEYLQIIVGVQIFVF